MFIHPRELLEVRAREMKDSAAFFVLRLGEKTYENFSAVSWKEFLSRVHRYESYLLDLGLLAGDRVAIQGYNGVEWIALDVACLSLGIISVPLFPLSHPDEVKFILKDSGSKILFSDREISDLNIPVKTFSEIELESACLNENTKRPELDPHICATIIYTSGTCGHPKGVMHSAYGIYSAMKAIDSMHELNAKQRLVSYLPLSHVAERTFVEFGSLYSGAQIYFLDRFEKLPHMLPKIRPTIFLGVPRIWEMFRQRIKRELQQNELLQSRLRAIPFFLRGFILARFLKKHLGLDKTKLCLSGAAKLERTVAEDFQRWGLPIHEAYGLTETLGIATMNPRGKFKLGSQGKCFRDVELRFESDGEICLRLPSLFLGYWNQPKESEEVLRGGWFRTGDIGQLDRGNYLFITDRKKNIFKLSTGKYVAPLPLESAIKAHEGILDAIVLGEGRSHCVALVVADLERLTQDSLEWTLKELNAKHSAHEQIKSVGVLESAWTIASGELTASLKPKRRVIVENNQDFVNELYESRTLVKFQMKEKIARAHSSF